MRRYGRLPALGVAIGIGILMVTACDLEEPDGSLAVETTAAGATVYIDGTAQSTTTANGETRYSLPPGSYDVLVFKLGSAPCFERVTVDSDETVRLSCDDPEPTVLLDDDFQQYSDTSEVSDYDGESYVASLQRDGDNQFLRIANDTDYYAVFNWPVDAAPEQNVVYAVSILGYAPDTSAMALYLQSDTTDGLYGFGDNFTFSRPNDPNEPTEVLDDTLPGIAERADTDLVIITVESRIFVLKNGDLVIDHLDSTETVQNISGLQAEVNGQIGDPAGTNRGDFDDILVYTY